jgi:gluconolactonase
MKRYLLILVAGALVLSACTGSGTPGSSSSPQAQGLSSLAASSQTTSSLPEVSHFSSVVIASSRARESSSAISILASSSRPAVGASSSVPVSSSPVSSSSVSSSSRISSSLTSSVALSSSSIAVSSSLRASSSSSLVKSSSSAPSSQSSTSQYLLTDPEGAGTLVLAANDQPHPKPAAGVPLGEVKLFTSQNRTVRVYLPHGYQTMNNLALMVFNDGKSFSGAPEEWAMHYVMDELIHNKEIPPMVGVFIDPINFNLRAEDYDSPNQAFTDAVLKIVADVKTKYAVSITDDPGLRGIAGHSSGGSAAFWMVWQNTALFGRIFSSAGMFNTAFAPYLDWAKKGDRVNKVRIALLTVASDRGQLHRPLTKALDQGGYNYFYVESTTGEHTFRTVRGEGKRMMRWLWLDWAKRQTGAANLNSINPTANPGTIKTLFTGGEFTEGPAWIPGENVLIFSDLRQNTTYRLTPPNMVDTYLKPNKRTNGAGWDPRGYLVLCQGEPAGVARGQYGGTLATIATEYNGKAFTMPNDNVVRSDGTIYVTDLQGRAAYRIDTNDNVDLIGEGYAPNGIALSPDEKYLYVTAKTLDNTKFHIWRYNLAANGATSNAKIHITLNAVSDGIAVDDVGNIYATTTAGIEVFKPSGDKWGVIKTPSQPTNLAFGGADRKTLYATTTDGKLLALPMPIPGLP